MVEVDSAFKEIASLFDGIDLDAIDNSRRRWLYSKVELIRLDLEEASLDTIEVHQRLDEYGSKLRLRPIKRRTFWWTPIDQLYRTIGVVSGFMLFGLLSPLAMMILRTMDDLLLQARLIDSFHQSSEALKRLMAASFLLLAGTSLQIEGLDPTSFQQGCAILTFTHASNLDGFIVSSTCPVRHYALAKKELFMIPFFSWVSLAIGGVPVDRSNRSRAVKALQRSVEAAKANSVALVIAPEG